MKMIKSCTDLSQSKTLSKILRHETADMFYVAGKGEPIFIGNKMVACGNDDYDALGVPDVLCWSLAALLSVLPTIDDEFEPQLHRSLDKYRCTYEGEEDSSGLWRVANNPVDACCELILKLHELKML